MQTRPTIAALLVALTLGLCASCREEAFAVELEAATTPKLLYLAEQVRVIVAEPSAPTHNCDFYRSFIKDGQDHPDFVLDSGELSPCEFLGGVGFGAWPEGEFTIIGTTFRQIDGTKEVIADGCSVGVSFGSDGYVFTQELRARPAFDEISSITIPGVSNLSQLCQGG